MLQCVAAVRCCSALLQCVVVRCSVLQCVIAVCCSVLLQCVAVRCSVLQCAADMMSHRDTMRHPAWLQCVAVCCCSALLQCVAVCCRHDAISKHDVTSCRDVIRVLSHISIRLVPCQYVMSRKNELCHKNT